MNNSRLTRWTRRRLGIVVGSVASSLLHRAGLETAEAKKRRKGKGKGKKKNKKRCAKLGDACRSGKKGACCGDATCEVFDGAATCCLGANERCSDSKECCNRICFEGSCIIR